MNLVYFKCKALLILQGSIKSFFVGKRKEKCILRGRLDLGYWYFAWSWSLWECTGCCTWGVRGLAVSEMLTLNIWKFCIPLDDKPNQKFQLSKIKKKYKQSLRFGCTIITVQLLNNIRISNTLFGIIV